MADEFDPEIILQKAINAVEDAIKDYVRGSEIDKIAKEFVQEQIKKRTRLGKDVAGKPFEPLKDSTIKKRKAIKGDLSSLTKPKKSNLTMTQQMTDGIVTSVKAGGGTAIIETEIVGDRNDSKLSNEQVAEYVEEAGRVFFGLTDPETKRLQREIAKGIVKSLNKKLG